jgi:cysteine synthase A
LNPAGSPKDRVALQIIREKFKSGELHENGTLVEGTSGSTGLSLALLAKRFNLKCVIFMPDDQATEKSLLLNLFGATVVLCKPVSSVNPDHYINRAKKYAKNTKDAVFCDQFETASNFRAHYEKTAPEIWKQTNGKIDAVVLGAGTGGTIAGLSRFFKEKNPSIKVYLIDPPGSSLFQRITSGVAYSKEQSERTIKRNRYDTIIEGVGLDRLTHNFLLAQVDGAIKCTDQEVIQISREILRTEGLFVGSSSAMNILGAMKVSELIGPNKTIVTLICDHGLRHLSRFWSKEYLTSKGFEDPSFAS